MPSRRTLVLVSLLLATPVVIFWLWLVIMSTSMAIQCPEECRCEGDGYIVNCSGSGLNSIPTILPKHMRQLIFDGNNIPFFAKNNFVSKGLDELRIITANVCKIRKIEVGAFNGLQKLTRLSMQSNEISELTPGTFEKLCHLENLHLARNKIKHLETNIFNGLVNLKYIFLQGNNLQYLHPDTFFGLPNLQGLYLSNNSGLQVPTDRHFINSLSLKQLGISGCNIRSVSVETFANVSALEWLDLSNNYLRILDINILKVLPKLSKLDLKSNDINKITQGKCEKISSLEYLSLQYNVIEHLESDVFCGLVNLKYIFLQGNNLKNLQPDTFVGLPNLQGLYLSKNSGLQIRSDRHFINSLSLKQLGISGCNVSSVSVETFENITALEWLDLSYNYLSSVDVNILKVLPKLTFVNLKRNKIIQIPPGTCMKLSSLEYLDLEYNIIEHLDIDVFSGCINLKYIDLEGNKLQYLHPDTFVGLPNLQRLFLSKNSGLQVPTDSHFINSLSLKRLEISGCNINSVSVETFANVTALELLDMSYNYLKSLDINILKVLPKLSHLKMDDNQIIKLIPDVFKNKGLLEYFDLENNEIEHLGIDVFCGLVNLKVINFQENNLQYLHPDTFVGLPKLQSLYLSKNAALQIPTNSNFINSLSLKILRISGCNIRSVSVETFANVSELETLDLSYNYLRSLDINILKVLPKLFHLKLDGNQINEIIPGEFRNKGLLEYLDLDNNKIEHLGIDVFYGLVNLKFIYLQENKLQYIYPDTFFGLPNLEILFLSKNTVLQIPTDRHFINSLSLIKLGISDCNISSVSVETFANVSALEQLDLSHNYLKSLDINILKVLPNLSHLYLESNEINEIIPGVFGNNSRLEFLDLDNNKIEHLGMNVFYGLVYLTDIYLQGNQLQYLHPETFLGLPKFSSLYLSINFGLQIPTERHFITSHSLKHLGISGCNISSVSVETFANVSALEFLNLGENNLKSLDISVLKALPQLSKMYLYGNPLHCDCQLQKVWRWCKDHNIETEYMEIVPECDTPSEVNGIWWGVVEKGQCLQGNIHYYGDYKNTRYSYTHIEDTDTEKDTGTKLELNTESVIKNNLFSFEYHYKVPLSAILFIFGTTGNVIIIIIITCNKNMRTAPNMYILNLAISDIIYLTVLFCGTLPGSVIRLSGDIICIFFSFCRRMPVVLTAYSIAVLSIQRYWVTVYPLQIRVFSQPTWRCTGATICGMWIVAALFAIPSVFTKDYCGSSVFVWLTNYYQRVAIFYVFGYCVLPLCIIAFSYIMASRHLSKSRFSLSEQTQNARQNSRKNTAKVVLGLTLVFIFSYLPSQIYEMYLVLNINFENSDEKILKEFEVISNLAHILSILDLFLSINSCLNPVALFYTSRAFRRYFKSYLTCCCKTKSSPTNLELTRRT